MIINFYYSSVISFRFGRGFFIFILVISRLSNITNSSFLLAAWNMPILRLSLSMVMTSMGALRSVTPLISGCPLGDILMVIRSVGRLLLSS